MPFVIWQLESNLKSDNEDIVPDESFKRISKLLSSVQSMPAPALTRLECPAGSLEMTVADVIIRKPHLRSHALSCVTG